MKKRGNPNGLRLRKETIIAGDEMQDKNLIIQDGVVCPCTPPWDPKVSTITGLPAYYGAKRPPNMLQNGH